MKPLKNWDNKTWLSSAKYISSFKNFLKSKSKINKNTKILDIGCGRANIISYLYKQYKFNNKPVGVDVIKNKNIKKNIIFIKIDAIKYLKKKNTKFDLILIKQTIHFFSKKQIKSLLKHAKNNLNKGGQILIFSLRTKNNKIPCFKIMKSKLLKSLQKDEGIFKVVKSNLKNYKIKNFTFKVDISKFRYIQMIKSRYISCLLNMSDKELKKGINEIKSIYKNRIKFTDTLNCISYKK
jgi:cyclopropane fatty-acyl-phospholipid synthase-like methyltransferase